MLKRLITIRKRIMAVHYCLEMIIYILVATNRVRQSFADKPLKQGVCFFLNAKVYTQSCPEVSRTPVVYQ